MQDEAYLQKLYTYLDSYHTQYDYTTVFFVSAVSGVYYYQNGYHKTITKENGHDIWYYNFLALNQQYDIQVDTDEANNDAPTIFVNYRMTDAQGKLLGVIGVAVELQDIQQIVSQYEQNYDLTIYLINRGGAPNSFSGKTDHFIESEEAARLLGMSEENVLTDSENEVVIWKHDNAQKNCMIDTYAPTLKWNMIVVKNTDSLRQNFYKKMLNNITTILGILAVCISVTTFIFYQYHYRM